MQVQDYQGLLYLVTKFRVQIAQLLNFLCTFPLQSVIPLSSFSLCVLPSDIQRANDHKDSVALLVARLRVLPLW